MRAVLLQLNVTDDPAANLIETRRLVCEAAGAGADFVLTPEATNCLTSNRAHQKEVLRLEGRIRPLRGYGPRRQS